MHALRRIHQALVPEGLLLDMHPIPPSTRAELGGDILGEFDDAEFMALVAAAEGKIGDSGLYAFESEVEFEYLERYEDAAELVEDIKEEWDGCSIPSELERRIRSAGAPVDVWEHVVLRKFRARRN